MKNISKLSLLLISSLSLSGCFFNKPAPQPQAPELVFSGKPIHADTLQQINVTTPKGALKPDTVELTNPKEGKNAKNKDYRLNPTCSEITPLPSPQQKPEQGLLEKFLGIFNKNDNSPLILEETSEEKTSEENDIDNNNYLYFYTLNNNSYLFDINSGIILTLPDTGYNPEYISMYDSDTYDTPAYINSENSQSFLYISGNDSEDLILDVQTKERQSSNWIPAVDNDTTAGNCNIIYQEDKFLYNCQTDSRNFTVEISPEELKRKISTSIALPFYSETNKNIGTTIFDKNLNIITTLNNVYNPFFYNKGFIAGYDNPDITADNCKYTFINLNNKEDIRRYDNLTVLNGNYLSGEKNGKYQIINRNNLQPLTDFILDDIVEGYENNNQKYLKYDDYYWYVDLSKYSEITEEMLKSAIDKYWSENEKEEIVSENNIKDNRTAYLSDSFYQFDSLNVPVYTDCFDDAPLVYGKNIKIENEERPLVYEFNYNKSGYGANWHTGDRSVDYTANAVFFTANNRTGAMDFNGELILPAMTANYPNYIEILPCHTHSKENQHTQTASLNWSQHYYVLRPLDTEKNIKDVVIDIDFEPKTDDWHINSSEWNPVYAELVLEDDKFYLETEVSEEKIKEEVNIDEIKEKSPDNFVVKYINNNVNTMGIVLLNQNAEKIHIIDGYYVYGYFANGYIPVSTKENGVDAYGHQGNFGKKTFVSAETGDEIAPAIYEDVLYFTDGYAAVKKDGKWGYINEAGKEVTDFIFDDATPVYSGKCFVKIGAYYRILDLSRTLDEKIKVTAETCEVGRNPSIDELFNVFGTDIKLNKNGDGIVIPGDESAEVLGTVTVTTNSLRFRNNPSVGSKEIGTAKRNQKYAVYDIKQSDFTWYSLSPAGDIWLANSGKWLSYDGKMPEVEATESSAEPEVEATVQPEEVSENNSEKSGN